MELHYIKNNFFMEDNEILKNINTITNIPSYIVQGRYDLICHQSMLTIYLRIGNLLN